MTLPAPGHGTIRHIFVVRLSALGDVLLCEPAVAALAERYAADGAEVTFVTREAYKDVYVAHPAVARIVTLEAARRRPPPDLVIDLHNRLDTRWLALRGRRRVVWRKRRGRALWTTTLGGRPLHDSYHGGPHQVERIAAALGLATTRRARMFLQPDWVARAEQLLGPPERPLAVLLPAASRPVKAWRAAAFAEVARGMGRAGFRVRVAGGPGEGDLLGAVARAGGAEALPETLGIGEVAAVLARAAVVVGNDSGLLHVAAAVGAPVVGVFGPTPPGRWGPPPEAGEVVTLDPACGPCSDHGQRPCRFARRVCLDDLPAARVVEAALRRARV